MSSSALVFLDPCHGYRGTYVAPNFWGWRHATIFWDTVAHFDRAGSSTDINTIIHLEMEYDIFGVGEELSVMFTFYRSRRVPRYIEGYQSGRNCRHRLCVDIIFLCTNARYIPVQSGTYVARIFAETSARHSRALHLAQSWLQEKKWKRNPIN